MFRAVDNPNQGGDAEEVLKHLMMDEGRMPSCVDTEGMSIIVVTDQDTNEPKAIGGFTFPDGSKLLAIPFELSMKAAMEEAGMAGD